MRKNGFTLIELLAVIVILAIIALIATPIILGIINDAREKSNERSVELYASAVRNAVAAYQLTGTTAPKSFSDLTIQYDGDVKCSVQELYSDGSFYLEGCKVNGITVEYTYGSKKTKIKTYINGDVVYYDVDNGVGCEGLYTESQSDTGVKTGCMKFYAFNDDGGDKINLILDHNTTSSAAWTSDGVEENTNGPIDVLTQLKLDTNNWVGTITPENYTMNQSTASSGANYTVDYSDYKARLITANEIAQITGNVEWDETSNSSNEYYFQDLSTNNQTGNGSVCASAGCTYGWLYDRTSPSCENYGCFNNSDARIYGYWTISSAASDSSSAWFVYYNGQIFNIFVGSGVGSDGDRGVRPVITVYKTQLQ